MNDGIIVLTGSALITFLSQIEELRDCPIEIEENDDKITVNIANSTYELVAETDSTIEVDEELVDEVDSINTDGYIEFDEEINDPTAIEPIEGDDLIEGGIIKELVKTLAVGGLVRLTKNAIENA